MTFIGGAYAGSLKCVFLLKMFNTRRKVYFFKMAVIAGFPWTDTETQASVPSPVSVGQAVGEAGSVAGLDAMLVPGAERGWVSALTADVFILEQHLLHRKT